MKADKRSESTTLKEKRIKREMERQDRFWEIATKFNNLFIQFKCIADEPVSFACSLLKTSSTARVYEILLEFPHVFSTDQIIFTKTWAVNSDCRHP